MIKKLSLFLIYVNDLRNCLKTTSLFAEDANLTASGDTINMEVKLEKDLKNIHQLLLAKKSTLNMDKTEYMIAGSR